MEDLALVQDESAEHVSQSRRVHVPIEEPEAPARIAEPKAAVADQDAEMVTKRKMIVDRFFLALVLRLSLNSLKARTVLLLLSPAAQKEAMCW